MYQYDKPKKQIRCWRPRRRWKYTTKANCNVPENVVSIQSSQDGVRSPPGNELPDLCKDIFLTSRMTFIFSSRTLLDAFRCTFPNPRASAVVKFNNARLYKNGLYIFHRVRSTEYFQVLSYTRLHTHVATTRSTSVSEGWSIQHGTLVHLIFVMFTHRHGVSESSGRKSKHSGL